MTKTHQRIKSPKDSNQIKPCPEGTGVNCFCNDCGGKLTTTVVKYGYVRLICDECVATLVAPTLLSTIKLRILKKCPWLAKEIKDYG